METTNVQVKKHNRIKKPYHCEKCGRGFALQRTKNRHSKYECGLPPMFQCPYCGILSKQTSPVYSHIRKKHPGLDVYVVDLRKKS